MTGVVEESNVAELGSFALVVLEEPAEALVAHDGFLG
jgi:hypothetical protein